MRNGDTVEVELSGKSAFVPLEARNGRYVVRRLVYGEAPPTVVRGRLTFSQAESQALRRNRKAGIQNEVCWWIAERIKNADV